MHHVHDTVLFRLRPSTTNLTTTKRILTNTALFGRNFWNLGLESKSELVQRTEHHLVVPHVPASRNPGTSMDSHDVSENDVSVDSTAGDSTAQVNFYSLKLGFGKKNGSHGRWWSYWTFFWNDFKSYQAVWIYFYSFSIPRFMAMFKAFIPGWSTVEDEVSDHFSRWVSATGTTEDLTANGCCSFVAESCFEMKQLVIQR